MNITLQDIITQANDYISNYTNGSANDGNRIRAVNRAIEFIKMKMTFPSDEKIFTFDFSQDNIFTDLPEDFNEGLEVLYHSQMNNVSANRWTYLPYADLLRIAGRQYTTENYFSWTPINGKMQLITLARNLNQGSHIETFDNIGSITGSNNASNLRIDNNIYAEGNGSLAFDIDPSLSALKTATIKWPTNYDFSSILKNSGLFKLGIFLPEDNITEVNLLLMTDANNYYSLSATTFDDGTAFGTGLNDMTKKVKFSFTGATIVGSPDIKKVKFIRVDEMMSGTFGSVIVEDYRIDNLYTIMPDKMDFIYLTSYKGTDKTGATNKIFLDSVDDICAFGNFAPDLVDVIACQTAMKLVPQVTDNADFRKMYKDDVKETMDVYGKKWPRKRVINHGRLILARPR